MTTGDIVSFKYKGGRSVRGEVLSVNSSGFGLKLHTDYIGKNVEWYAGEFKHFNTKECRKLKVTNPAKTQ